MFKENCTVLDNRKVAPGHWVIRFNSGAIAKAARPGQFVQILCTHDSFDPLLPRPFSFLDANGGEFSILYHAVGRGTVLLSKVKRGDSLSVVGPLGNGFSPEPGAKNPGLKVLIGGGVGIPPLFHLAGAWLKKKIVKNENIHVFLGARNKSLLLCEKEFKKLGVRLNVSTDDGSKGSKGFITASLTHFLQAHSSDSRPHLYACGPTPMLKVVSAIALRSKVPCDISVEVPMACGFGACLGCAIKVRGEGTGHRFAVACTEGPVFQASEIVWD